MKALMGSGYLYVCKSSSEAETSGDKVSGVPINIVFP